MSSKGNPCDGHTLGKPLTQVRNFLGEGRVPEVFVDRGLPGPQTRGGENRVCGPRKAGIDPQKLVEVYQAQSGARTRHWAHEK
jgi:hypothetical protein